jgi:hypothetical protein
VYVGGIGTLEHPARVARALPRRTIVTVTRAIGFIPVKIAPGNVRAVPVTPARVHALLAQARDDTP